MAESSIQLPIIDLASPDRTSTVRAIRQAACVEVGFFYLVNHGVDEKLFKQVLEQSKKFFTLPLEERMKVLRKNHRGFAPLYADKLDPSSNSQGDSKESFYIGPLEGKSVVNNLNQWPAEEVLSCWRSTMEEYHTRVMDARIRLIRLLALALELDEDFFHKVGACDLPNGYLRLLHYPGELHLSEQVVYGSHAHSDFGMLTLLATDGVGGLQVCREKFNKPQIWEDVHHLNGSTLHRVMLTGQDRYSFAFFFDPNPDCVVECLKSFCSDSSPPRFPPIRSGDYLEERLRSAYTSSVSTLSLLPT